MSNMVKKLQVQISSNEAHTPEMILSFRTDRPWQIVKTQIRLLLEEQSDQGLHCLSFHLHFLYTSHHRLNFCWITANIFGVRKFRSFTVIPCNFSRTKTC